MAFHEEIVKEDSWCSTQMPRVVRDDYVAILEMNIS